MFASFVAAAVEAAGRVCARSCCRRPASVFGERFVRVPPLIQGARPSAPQLANYSHTSICPSASLLFLSLPHFRAVSGTGYSVYSIPVNSHSPRPTNQHSIYCLVPSVLVILHSAAAPHHINTFHHLIHPKICQNPKSCASISLFHSFGCPVSSH